MPRPSTEERLTSVHEDALIEFETIQCALRDERLQCLQDRRFATIAGAQWEGPLGLQFENKPKLEVNKIRKSIDDICEDYQNNRIDAMFISKDGATDEELANTCASLHRSDEQDSSAREAYDNAFEEAVCGGIGAWRLRARYEDEEDEDDEIQRIQFEPIFDADSSVFFDLDAKKQDKSDARCCYVITSLTRAEYERRYDDDPANWPKIVQQRWFDWLTPDVVYVAEYFVKEKRKDVVHYYKGLSGDEISHSQTELDEDEDLARTLKATGFKKTHEKKVTRTKVHKYIMSGNAILEDCGFIAGSEIPIVVVYANRWFIDNVERCMGHGRLAKDSQRVMNMQISKLAEISAMSTVEKPIVTPEQIAGHQLMWAEDNIKNWPYLLINPVMDAAGQQAISGPTAYTKSPPVPAAMAALLQLTNSNMEDILRSGTDTEKIVSHVSGKTVEATQQRIDRKSFRYVMNMSKAIRWSAKVWLSMARELYVKPGRQMKVMKGNFIEPDRNMRGTGLRGNYTKIELQKPIIGPDGRVTKANDLTKAKFDVAVEVGPSSLSKRDATVRMVTDMLAVTQDPSIQAILSYTALLNMDGEGIEDIRKAARMALLQKGIGDPTPEEAQKMAQQKQQQAQNPSPQDQYAMAEAQKAQADSQRAQADMALIAARTEKTKVDSVVALAGVNADREKAAMDQIKTLSDIHLGRSQAMTQAAESLHGMMTTPLPGQDPASGGPGGGQ